MALACAARRTDVVGDGGVAGRSGDAARLDLRRWHITQQVNVGRRGQRFGVGPRRNPDDAATRAIGRRDGRLDRRVGAGRADAERRQRAQVGQRRLGVIDVAQVVRREQVAAATAARGRDVAAAAILRHGRLGTAREREPDECQPPHYRIPATT